MADEKNQNEQKQTIDEKDQNEKMQSVEEEDLEQVSGGRTRLTGTHSNPVVRRDAKGNPTHWRDPVQEGWIYCYRCPNCGKVLHQGAFGRLYCDPCDESWFAMSLKRRYI